MTTVAFVQARMGSVRFPGKSLARLGSYPLIEWVLRRVRMTEKVSRVVLLTSALPANDALTAKAQEIGCDVLRGDENDVLSRFIEGAARFPSENYLRICADNPFICPKELGRLIDFHEQGGFDYSFNHVPKLENGYADGFGAEAMTSATLEKLGRLSGSVPKYREHVTSYLWDHVDAFRIGVVPAPEGLRDPSLRFDIDTAADLERLQPLARSVEIGSSGIEVVACFRKLKAEVAHA